MFNLLFTLLFLVLLPSVVILPGWLWAQRWQPQSAWLLGLPCLGAALWVMLVMAGIGTQQSLSNIVELFVVQLVAVLAAYLKLWVLNRQAGWATSGNLVVLGIVVATAVLLRLLMPTLQE